MVRRRMFRNSGRLDAKYMFACTRKGGRGKRALRAVEAIHLGFTSDCNMSGYVLYIPSTGKCMVSNDAEYDEDVLPNRNKEMIEEKLAEDSDVKILSEVKRPVKWIDFTPEINLNDFEVVYVGSGEH
jgi:hypothetical protein